MITRRQLLANAGQLSLLATMRSTAASAQDGPLRRAIPKTGELLPIIGLGTYRTFNVGEHPSELEPLRQVTQRFFESGGTLVDSSPQYGPSESAFGRVLRGMEAPAELFAATKVSADGAEEGIRQMEESPRKMGVERIDLMQIHNLREWRTHLPTLKAWKEEGRFRYIGISASREELYEEYLTVMRSEPLDFIQINYSVAERKSAERILPLAMDRGMAVLINRPFVAGALFPRVANQPLPDWAAEFDCESWGQFFLKFVLSHPAVTVALQATSSPRHLSDNMGAARGRMPDAALRRRMVSLIGVTGRPPWT
jgi:diketogulonate reductase-like aldo/keto reductase